METRKISSLQAIILLSMSRIFNTLNFIPALGQAVSGTAAIYGTVISFAIQAVMIIPALILCKKCPGESVINVAYKSSRTFGNVLAILYLIIFFSGAVGGISGFNFFMTNAVYPDASIAVIAVTMCAVCFYCTKNGIQGIARASTILFLFFAAGLIVIALSSFDSIKSLNFRPILDNPISSVAGYTLESISKTTELAVLLLLFPRVNGSPKKTTYWFLIISCFIGTLISFLTAGILGEFGLTQAFPYFAITSVIDLKIFQRLDAIHLVSWVFISFVHTTLFAGFAIELLKQLLPQKIRKISGVSLFIPAVAITVFLSYRGDILKKINSQTAIILFLAVTLVPCILLIIIKKAKKTKEGRKGRLGKNEKIPLHFSSAD